MILRDARFAEYWLWYIRLVGVYFFFRGCFFKILYFAWLMSLKNQLQINSIALFCKKIKKNWMIEWTQTAVYNHNEPLFLKLFFLFFFRGWALASRFGDQGPR